MGDALTRPLFDNRMLRASGAPDLRVGLGAAIRALADQPMLGGVLASGLRSGAILNERQSAIAVEDFQRQGQIARLTDELEFTVDRGSRDDIRERLKLLAEPTGTVTLQTQQAIADGELQTPEALAEKYADLGLTFEYAMSNEDAQIIADMNRAEIIRNAIVSRSPSGIIPTAAKFGAGLLAMATDPLEVATMFIPIVGAGGKAYAAARFGRFGGRVAVGAVEGGVGQALTEPLYYGLSQAAQLDYEMSDSLLSVGLGFAFGGGIGAVAGVLSRGADARAAGGAQGERIDYPDRLDALDPEFSREVSGAAFRQFVNDGVVDIARFIDGRDLRGTTTLSRAGGIEFQAAQDLPLAASAEIRPSYIALGPDGKPRTFDTLRNADRAAAVTGGVVEPTPGGFVVRQPVEGDMIRRPDGMPLSFGTERAAEKFIDAAAGLRSADAAVFKAGPRSFLIAKGVAEDTLAKMRASPETVTVPRGINTREVAVLPNAQAQIRDAVRGTLATRQMAEQLAAPQPSRLADPRASEEATLSVERPVDEETAELETMIAQIEHTETMKADIELARQIDATAKAQSEVVEAVSACLARV